MRHRIILMVGLSCLMLAMALVTALITSASDQSLSTIAVPEGGTSEDAPSIQSEVAPDATTAPSFCKPCLYFSGDFNPSNLSSTGEAEGNNLFWPVVYIFTPFTVPSGKHWHVTGLVIGMLIRPSGSGAIDPPTAGWSIWQGLAASTPGTLVAAGVGSAALLPTGATFFHGAFSFTVYNVTVKVRPTVKLNPGTYFMNVIPQCTNPADSSCGSITYESNVADASPTHSVGPASILNDSFILYPALQWDYLPAVSSLYSFGIVGTQ